jgi:quercetin dioxygenase-like cupin family protein
LPLTGTAGEPAVRRPSPLEKEIRMKIIPIEQIPGVVPPQHYDLIGRPVFSSGGTRVSFTRMEKTGRCDPHVHEQAQQLFIVLKGAMLFKSESEEILVTEGHAVLFAAGEVHSNDNAADLETEYLTVTVEAGE